MEYVITFINTNYAIKSEQILLEMDIDVAVMPLPSEINAGCGICLRLNSDDIEKTECLLRDASVEFETYKHISNTYMKK